MELQNSQKTSPQNNSVTNEEEISKENYIYPEKIQKLIDYLRLILYNNGISKNKKLIR